LEETIKIESVDPISVFGVNNVKLKAIKNLHPKLKIIARGSVLKVMGSEEEIANFKRRLMNVITYIEQYGDIKPKELEHVLMDEEIEKKNLSDEVLVYGSGGRTIKAKTENQRKLVQAVNQNDLTFAVGPAGTGKTFTAVALAVRALKNKEVKRIILTRPAVESGENLGFLPGDLREKLDPYMQPLYDALRAMIPVEKLKEYIETGVVEVAPLAFMRGRTLDNAFVILDEGQNATEGQIRMFLTRMGSSAKFVVTGDATQIDLPKRTPSGLLQALNVLDKVKGIGFIQLDGRDVVRHPLVGKIIDAYKVIDEVRGAGEH
jgi:phosphate starvation-inducible PhoH-like protein